MSSIARSSYGEPSMTISQGTTLWEFRGNRHRLDGPAVIWVHGVEEWWQYGKRHRIGGPAIYGEVSQIWCVDNVFHRIDGPAIISPEKTQWWVNGKMHRIDGPAHIAKSGQKKCGTCLIDL